MRELRHPWLLMHNRDRESRRRCTKPHRQYELSGATSLLSLGYLFYHPQDPLKVYVGSLGPAFTYAFLAFRKSVRQAFALTLCSRFPSWMSLSLGPIDIFSTGRRPSRTARLLLFSYELVTSWTISSITQPIGLAKTTPHFSYLFYVSFKKPQQQVAVKIHKVFASH